MKLPDMLTPNNAERVLLDRQNASGALQEDWGENLIGKYIIK